MNISNFENPLDRLDRWLLDKLQGYVDHIGWSNYLIAAIFFVGAAAPQVVFGLREYRQTGDFANMYLIFAAVSLSCAGLALIRTHGRSDHWMRKSDDLIRPVVFCVILIEIAWSVLHLTVVNVVFDLSLLLFAAGWYAESCEPPLFRRF